MLLSSKILNLKKDVLFFVFFEILLSSKISDLIRIFVYFCHLFLIETLISSKNSELIRIFCFFDVFFDCFFESMISSRTLELIFSFYLFFL